jgi:hypothetical protein
MAINKKILFGSVGAVAIWAGGYLLLGNGTGTDSSAGSDDDVPLAHVAGSIAAPSPVRAEIENENGNISAPSVKVSDRKYRRMLGVSRKNNDQLTVDPNWCDDKVGTQKAYMELSLSSPLLKDENAQRMMASSSGRLLNILCPDAKKQTMIFEDSRGNVISQISGDYPVWVSTAAALDTQALDLDNVPKRGAVITFFADETKKDGTLIKSRPIGKYTVSDNKVVALTMEEPVNLFYISKRTPYPRYGSYSVTMTGSYEVTKAGDYKFQASYSGPQLPGLARYGDKRESVDRCLGTVAVNGKPVAATKERNQEANTLIALVPGYHDIEVTMRCATTGDLIKDLGGNVHGDLPGLAARYLQAISVKITSPGDERQKSLRYTDLQFGSAS